MLFFPISGDIDNINTQVKASNQSDHGRNPNLISTATHCHRQMLDVSSPTLSTYMADAEAASIRETCRSFIR